MTIPVTPGLNTREYNQEFVEKTKELDRILYVWTLQSRFHILIDEIMLGPMFIS